MTWRFQIIYAVVLLGVIVAGCKKQSDFDALFTDMSIGVPEYESISEFTHPADTVKGDNFTATFIQSDEQFNHFMATLGVSQAQVLSSSGTRVSANSKIDPKYPWELTIKAEITNAPDKKYIVSMDGRQPYN